MMRKWLLVFLLAVLSLPVVYEIAPYEVLKLKTFDALIPEQQPSGYFTILNVTEADIEKEGGYPLSRQTLARIQVDLLNEGAMGVGYVIAFPQPDRFGGDAQFAEALSYGPSVLAMFENDNGEYPPTTGTVILGDDVGGINVEGSRLGTTVEFRRGKGKRNQGGAEDTEKCFGRKGIGDAPGPK